jgi:peptidylprolyl isomerase
MLPALNLGLRANFCDIFYQNSFCIRSRSTMSHMASLADLPEVIGFFSYSRDDDESYKGRLSALREAIHQELSAQLGRSKKAFRLWQDREAIAPGKLWELEITNAVEQSVFFIPIVTPRAVNSDYCKFEFESFLTRERGLGRADLVFPILYVPVPALEDEARWRGHPVLSVIAKRQYVDWQTFRYADVHTPTMREEIARFAFRIVEALNQPWVSPQEIKRRKDAETQKRADEERLRQEGEAKQRANEEEQRRQAEARQRAEEERRSSEAEVRQRADEERAFATAKTADSIGAVDMFLVAYPKGHLAGEAKALRTMLVECDNAYKVAIGSHDPAVLNDFLDRYPTGKRADKVRNRLRRVERGSWLSRRGILIGGASLGVSALAAAAVTVSRQNGPIPKTAETSPVPKTAETSPVPETAETSPVPSIALPAGLDKANAIVIDTTKGRIVIKLRPDLAPQHAERIKQLAREGFYNNVPFHRVIDGFMAQTGDGQKFNGTGGSKYPNLKEEFSHVHFKRGVVGMARRGDSVDSANSQFFIMFADAPNLDGQYTVIGEVVRGMDVVDKLKKALPDAVGGIVIDPDKMVKVQVASDIK